MEMSKFHSWGSSAKAIRVQSDNYDYLVCVCVWSIIATWQRSYLRLDTKKSMCNMMSLD